MEQQKVVILGDGAIGKTALFIVFARNKFPYEYIPTVFEIDFIDITVDGKNVSLGLWDTCGGEDYAGLRPLRYPEFDVVLLCYDIGCRVSFENIPTYWFSEVQHHYPNVPIILCGNKLDLRDDQANLEKQNQTPVTKEEGIKMAADINAYAYVECSAKRKEGVREVFEEAVRAAFYVPPPKKKTKCVLL